MAWDKKKQALYMREHNLRMRKAVIALLGDKCAKCGFSDWRALQVDHINQRAPHEDKSNSMKKFCQILNGKRAVTDYQLLCANCNTLKVWDNDELARVRKY